MIVWVKKKAVQANCDQRAEILGTRSFPGCNIVIKVQLLGTNYKWLIQPQDIIGFEINGHRMEITIPLEVAHLKAINKRLSTRVKSLETENKTLIVSLEPLRTKIKILLAKIKKQNELRELDKKIQEKCNDIDRLKAKIEAIRFWL